MKMRCREVRKVILGMGRGEDKETPSLISAHISKCKACESLLAASRRLERVLTEETSRLNVLAQDSHIGKGRLPAEIFRPMPPRRIRRLRAAWAGAAALILLTVGASTLYLLGRRGNESESERGAPLVTEAVAAAASSQTLWELVEVTKRHKAPSFDLPHTSAATQSESLVPQFLRECRVQSRETFRSMVQSEKVLTRRNES